MKKAGGTIRSRHDEPAGGTDDAWQTREKKKKLPDQRGRFWYRRKATSTRNETPSGIDGDTKYLHKTGVVRGGKKQLIATVKSAPIKKARRTKPRPAPEGGRDLTGLPKGKPGGQQTRQEGVN